MRTREEIEALLIGGDRVAPVAPGGIGAPERWMVWKRHFERGPSKALVALSRELDLAEKRVLDVGCGYGESLIHFAPSSLGVDRLAERVTLARSLGLRAETRDVERAGWHAGLGDFDLVWIADLLADLDDPTAFLRGVPAVLAPKGRIAIAEDVWPEGERAARIAAHVSRRELPRRERRLTDAVLATILDAAGLDVERTWCPAFEARWAGALLRGVFPARTILARVRRVGHAPAHPKETSPDADAALRTHVLVPRPADPRRRDDDLRRRAGVARAPRGDVDRDAAREGGARPRVVRGRERDARHRE